MSRHASLNRAFTLAWNEAQQCYVPAPETSRRRGKRSSTVVAAAVAALFTSGTAQAADGPVLPTGGRVVAGQAAIGQSGNTTTIQQGSSRAAIDWQSFSIGRDASVNFVQPGRDSVVLNRVVGQDPSRILGSLTANGQVFIVNPNGVLFAPGAQVSAAGVLASTRNMSNEDFLAGRYVLQGSGNAGVINQGRIDAATGGYVVLIGAQIVNEGSITAPLGDVRLAAADQVTLQIDRGGLTGFTVDRGTLDALAANKGLIKADGGRIFLTADALDRLARAVVNNEGVIEAHTVQNQAGKIVLLGDMHYGSTVVGGRLDASAPNGGDGGFIETSAAQVTVVPGAVVKTDAAAGNTGLWLIDPTDFTVAASGGDITGAALGTALGSSNVTIQSTTGAGGVAGNVNVNDTVSWSTNLLTLNALNNVNVNADMNGSGTAQLAFEYGQGAVAAGNTSRYNLADGINIDLPAGNNFSTRQGSDGVVKNFIVVTSLGAANSVTTTDLQGIQGDTTLNYAIGADIAAGSTAGWNAGFGFETLGTPITPFSGNLEGLGHTVSGLTIARPGSDIGFIGVLATGSTVSNLVMTGVSVTGGNSRVGGVVGLNQGTVDRVSASGSVSGSITAIDGTDAGGLVGANDGTVRDSVVNMTVAGLINTGGLVGRNAVTGVITGSTSSGSVTGAEVVGGLVGYSQAPLIGLSSSATVNGGGYASGGLVGQADALVSGSTASGAVSGDSDVGGLIGTSSSDTVNSSASGNVTGSSFSNRVGGLIGVTTGNISGSHATGDVSGRGNVGGLAGRARSTVDNSYAIGNVSGTGNQLGGLLGMAEENVTNSYATGNVTGSTANSDNVGGLIGYLVDNSVTDSHASGNVIGLNNVGGLAGQAVGNTALRVHATGNVTGTGEQVGGLIGYSGISVDTAYATGIVIGDSRVGGLVGYGSITVNSHATGAASGVNSVGGLVGEAKMGGVTSNSYATGNVTGTDTATGGLVGRNRGSVEGASYSTSLVVGVSRTGGLVGENFGSVTDSVTGHAGVAGPVVTGDISTGGLVGRNRPGATVTNSQATGNVLGSSANTGGLVGDNEGSITGSTANGTVTGNGSTGGLAGNHANGASISGSVANGAVVGTGSGTGGLAGYSDGEIVNSTASNTVRGDLRVGGLVGAADTSSTITDSSASGAVTETTSAGGFMLGGLVGENRGAILRGGATGNVVGDSLIGGLVGFNYGGITSSTASGRATASGAAAGGLAGQNNGAVSLSQASGRVITVYDYAGGLVGYNLGSIAGSSASGQVSGDSKSGGFVGYHAGAGSIVDSTASGAVNGVSQIGGFAGSSGATIADSSTSSTVLGSGSQLGGFAGYNEAALTHVTATGNVSGSNSNMVGGLVGRHVGSAAVISGGSSAAGQVSASGTAVDVGGLVGHMTSGAQITGGAVAIGAVSGVENVGGLVGNLDGGSITFATASGTVTGQTNVGGFAGTTNTGTSVASSSTAGAVVGSAANTGGFVGTNRTLLSGNAANGVSATGTVTSTGSNTGGFAGANSGTVSEVRAANAVSGNLSSGGVVGRNTGLVERSRATNTVTASSNRAGGLVGENAAGTVTLSYAAGSVSGASQVGGLVGLNSAAVNTSYASAAATGLDDVGGLIGNADAGSTVANAYATGAVAGRDNVGGLIGSAGGSAQFTYASGAVTGSGVNAGGLIGIRAGAVIGDSFYNITTTGQAHSSGDFATNGEVAAARTTAQMNRAATFTGWNLATTGSQANIWRAYDGYAAPLLTYWLTPLTIAGTANAVNRVYDGQTQTTTVGGNTWVDTLAPGHVLGSASTVSGRNAGSYAATSGYYSDQQGYDLTQAVTSLTITPAALTAALTGVTKVYDGNTNVTLTSGNFVLSGFVSGEGAGVTRSSGVLNSRNVLDANIATTALAPADFAALVGTDLGNYFLPTSATGAASITPKSIVVSLQGNVSRMTDGTTTARLDSGNFSIGGVVAGESIGLGALLGTYDSAAAGTGKLVTVAFGAADYRAGSGTLLGNYVLTSGTVAAPIGVLVSENTPSGQPQATVGDPFVATAIAAAIVSLPNTPSGQTQATIGDLGVDTAPNRTIERREVLDPIAPAPGSVVSTNTKENLLFRRTFSIGDGGIRLPQGVRGSDKDSAQ